MSEFASSYHQTLLQQVEVTGKMNHQAPPGTKSHFVPSWNPNGDSLGAAGILGQALGRSHGAQPPCRHAVSCGLRSAGWFCRSLWQVAVWHKSAATGIQSHSGNFPSPQGSRPSSQNRKQGVPRYSETLVLTQFCFLSDVNRTFF